MFTIQAKLPAAQCVRALIGKALAAGILALAVTPPGASALPCGPTGPCALPPPQCPYGTAWNGDGCVRVLPAGTRASGSQMLPGQVLTPGQSLRSANGQYVYTYQGDGNLVLYDYGEPVWATGTAGSTRGELIMQADGNLVMYAPGFKPLWASNTAGHPGTQLAVQDDGDVVIHDTAGGPVWATGPHNALPVGPAATGHQMQPGELLAPGDALASGRYRFVYQTDGNLVLYAGSCTLWSTRTSGYAAGRVVMQGDGNLVIYAPGPVPVWSSGTQGHSGSHLTDWGDGGVTIDSPAGTTIWSTGTEGLNPVPCT